MFLIYKCEISSKKTSHVFYCVIIFFFYHWLLADGAVLQEKSKHDKKCIEAQVKTVEKARSNVCSPCWKKTNKKRVQFFFSFCKHLVLTSTDEFDQHFSFHAEVCVSGGRKIALSTVKQHICKLVHFFKSKLKID